MEEIGEKIIALRKAHGLSQEKLAELANVSRQTIYKWESNSALPSNDNIKSLCQIFSVTGTYFYGEIAATSTQLSSDKLTQKTDKNSIKKRFIVGLIINSVLLAITFFLTIWFGFVAFSPNKGAITETTLDINLITFIIILIIAAILLIIEVIIIYKVNKRNVNKM